MWSLSVSPNKPLKKVDLPVIRDTMMLTWTHYYDEMHPFWIASMITGDLLKQKRLYIQLNKILYQ